MRPLDFSSPCEHCGDVRATASQPSAPTPEPNDAQTPVRTAPPSTKPARSPWVTVALVVGGVGLCSVTGLCVVFGFAFKQGFDAVLRDAGSSELLTSRDGLVSIDPQGALVSSTTLDDNAPLQLWNPREELYLLGFSEPKSDLDPGTTLEHYGTLITEAMMVENRTIGAGSQVTVGGRPGLEYRVTGRVNDFDVVYWVTVVESEQYFHQLSGWTLANREMRHAATMRRVVASAQVRSTPEAQPAGRPARPAAASPAAAAP